MKYAKKVQDLREAQKAFFRSRHKRHLENSKRLEKEVDNMTEDILKQQGSLF